MCGWELTKSVAIALLQAIGNFTARCRRLGAMQAHLVVCSASSYQVPKALRSNPVAQGQKRTTGVNGLNSSQFCLAKMSTFFLDYWVSRCVWTDHYFVFHMANWASYWMSCEIECSNNAFNSDVGKFQHFGWRGFEHRHKTQRLKIAWSPIRSKYILGAHQGDLSNLWY